MALPISNRELQRLALAGRFFYCERWPGDLQAIRLSLMFPQEARRFGKNNRPQIKTATACLANICGLICLTIDAADLAKAGPTRFALGFANRHKILLQDQKNR